MAEVSTVGPSEPPSLDGMDEETAVATMAEWFSHNFEDPSQEMPYDGREGGFQYIHGGPYDASEEIYAAFSDADETWIEQAVDEVQSDGMTDWAPAGWRTGQFEDDYHPDDEPPRLADRLDSLGAQLTQIEQHIAYWRNRPAGLGHNRAPDEFRLSPDDADLTEAQESVEEVRRELAKPDRETAADPVVVERAEGRFSRLAKKIATAIAAAGGALVMGVIGGAGKHIGEELAKDPSSFFLVLEHAAATLHTWASSLTSLF
jgi:hypothetical protein